MLEPNFPYKCPFNCSIARSTLVNSSLFSSMLFLSLVLFVRNISSAFDFSVSKKHSPKTRSHFESSSAKVISDAASSVSSNCFCLREKSTFYSCGEKKKCVRTSREAIIARNSCVRLFKRPNAHMRCWSSQLTSTSCFVGGFEVVVGSIVVICIRIQVAFCVSEEKREEEEEEKKDGFKTLNYEYCIMSTKP